MSKPNQHTTWDFKFKRRRFQTTSKKIKQKKKSRYKCHTRIVIVLTWHSGGTIELWNLKAKCGYIKNVQAIFMKEYKSFKQVYGGPKYVPLKKKNDKMLKGGMCD